jgi:cathepsin B
MLFSHILLNTVPIHSFKMMKTATLFAVAGAASAMPADLDSMPAMRAELIEEINSMKTTWRAAMPVRFQNATIADVKRQLGTILPGHKDYLELPARTDFADTAVPEAFDVRTNWPECAAITGRVRDQSNCGSCWAFGSTEAFNDRHCIATGDASTVFSVTDTLACCTGLACGFSMGCNGGQPSGAWKFFTTDGTVTGGDWADMGTGTTCEPYPMQSCAHHVAPPPGMPACDDIDSYKTPQCAKTCTESNYGTAFSKDKHFAKDSYSVKGEANMQKELMEKGTLSVSMTVYEDFEAYTSGVYQHVTGKNLGGHAIKMVGWGVDNGVKYWTCVNSWNDSWGENGQFRIKRGNNECGIEDGVVAGTVVA